MLESLLTRLARVIGSENDARAEASSSPQSTPTCLRFARLCGASLRGADLRGANLRSADLTGAIIDHRTDFRGANLCGADMRVDERGGQRLGAARFSAKTVYDEQTRFPASFDPEVVGLTLISKTRMESRADLSAYAST